MPLIPLYTASCSPETVLLEGLERYHLRQELLQHHLAAEPPARVLSLLRSAGYLPHGQVGVSLFEREWPTVEAFAARLRAFLTASPSASLEVDLTLGAFRLLGRLDEVTPRGLLRYRLGRTRGRDYLDLWICHLLLNAMAPDEVERMSHWLAEDREVTMPPVYEAEALLQDLLTWYWQGLRRPLPLFPESSLAYAQALQQQASEPLAAARKCWASSDYQRGEDADAYYQLALREQDPLDGLFVVVAEAVFAPLLTYL